MIRFGMTLLTVGLVFGIGQAKAEDKGDKDKIQGEWSLVTREDNGQSEKITEDNEHFIKLKIEGDKFMVTLKICIGGPEAPDRPAEFKSKDEVKLFTFKRVKK